MHHMLSIYQTKKYQHLTFVARLSDYYAKWRMMHLSVGRGHLALTANTSFDTAGCSEAHPTSFTFAMIAPAAPQQPVCGSSPADRVLSGRFAAQALHNGSSRSTGRRSLQPSFLRRSLCTFDSRQEEHSTSEHELLCMEASCGNKNTN